LKSLAIETPPKLLPCWNNQ